MWHIRQFATLGWAERIIKRNGSLSGQNQGTISHAAHNSCSWKANRAGLLHCPPHGQFTWVIKEYTKGYDTKRDSRVRWLGLSRFPKEKHGSMTQGRSNDLHRHGEGKTLVEHRGVIMTSPPSPLTFYLFIYCWIDLWLTLSTCEQRTFLNTDVYHLARHSSQLFSPDWLRCLWLMGAVHQ